jgi:hypothetical protein
MRHLIILFAATGCVGPEQPLVFRNVSVGGAITNPVNWRRPIQVCGNVVEGRGPDGEWILARTNRYGGTRWLLVDVSAGEMQLGTEACVRGVVRRRDGLTEAEAAAQGRLRTIEDAPDTHYALYPCSDGESCRAAGGTVPE